MNLVPPAHSTPSLDYKCIAQYPLYFLAETPVLPVVFSPVSLFEPKLVNRTHDTPHVVGKQGLQH